MPARWAVIRLSMAWKNSQFSRRILSFSCTTPPCRSARKPYWGMSLTWAVPATRSSSGIYVVSKTLRGLVCKVWFWWEWLTSCCQRVVLGFSDVQIALQLSVHKVPTPCSGKDVGARGGDLVMVKEAAPFGDLLLRVEAAWGLGVVVRHVDFVYVGHVNPLYVRHLEEYRIKCDQRRCRGKMRIEHSG